MDNKVLKLKEVARFLRVHPTTLYRMVRRGEIPCYKVGPASWRVNVEDLEKWLKERSVA